MFEVSRFTVRLFTALQYRYNEDESVPGIISDEKGFGVRLPTVTTGSVCECERVWHQGLQLPPLSWMPLLRAAEGGDKGDGEGGTTEAKCPLCSMVSCRELLVSGQSGLPGSSLVVKITQNKGEKGNNHKSTSSDNLAGCVLMRKGALGLQEIRSGLIKHLEPR